MIGTAKAILIVGGVGVGAFVLLQLLKPRASTPAASAPRANGDLVFAAGLVNLGTSLFDAYDSRNKTNPNEGIDPTTGGVVLAPGQVYGP